MELSSFKDLFIFLLSDIYIIENQLLVEVPKMVAKAHSEKLKEALKTHLGETKNQIKRLDRAFKLLGEKPRTVEWSRDVKHLFSDAEKFLKSNPSSPLLDAAIIVIAQRIEHYEIATYGTLREFANVLDNDEIKSILKESLKEEAEADTVLTKLAKGGMFSAGINVEATLNV